MQDTVLTTPGPARPPTLAQPHHQHPLPSGPQPVPGPSHQACHPDGPAPSHPGCHIQARTAGWEPAVPGSREAVRRPRPGWEPQRCFRTSSHIAWGRGVTVTPCGGGMRSRCWQASWHLAQGAPAGSGTGHVGAARIWPTLAWPTASAGWGLPPGTASPGPLQHPRPFRPPEREALACKAPPPRSPALREAPQSWAGGRVSSTEQSAGEPRGHQGLALGVLRGNGSWAGRLPAGAQPTGDERPGEAGLPGVGGLGLRVFDSFPGRWRPGPPGCQVPVSSPDPGLRPPSPGTAGPGPS